MKPLRDGALAGLALLTCVGLPKVAEANEVVWQWFGRCTTAQQMHVDIQLDGRALYSKAFPACAMPRADIPAESPQKVLEFSFRGPAGLLGSEFDRLGTLRIVGNIWRAGGEPDALLLGVSFATPDRVLLNSVHIATARRPARSTVAKGLVVHTSAVRNEPGSRVR